MYLSVKVDERFDGEFAGDKLSLALAAGEVPSEPGGVGARPIPFAAGNTAQKMSEYFVALAANSIRRDGAARVEWAKLARVGGGKSCRGAGGCRAARLGPFDFAQGRLAKMPVPRQVKSRGQEYPRH